MDSLANIKHIPTRKSRPWQRHRLDHHARVWFRDMTKRLGKAGPRSTWWPYAADFLYSLSQVIDDVINSTYQLKSRTTSSHDGGLLRGSITVLPLYLKRALRKRSVYVQEGFWASPQQKLAPMIEFIGHDSELCCVWCYQGRLVLHLLYILIKPSCKHKKGPNKINRTTKRVKKALTPGLYEYISRHDVSSFYASIYHQKLIALVHRHFDDPILAYYLEANIAIDSDGLIRLPNKCLPLRNTLPPFLAVLNLPNLDKPSPPTPQLSLRPKTLSSPRKRGSSAFSFWTPTYAWAATDRAATLTIRLLKVTMSTTAVVGTLLSSLKILAGHPATLCNGGLSRGNNAARPLDTNQHAQRASVAPKIASQIRRWVQHVRTHDPTLLCYGEVLLHQL